MNLTFKPSRFITYLKYLGHLHFIKTIIPFLGIGGFYLFYFLIQTGVSLAVGWYLVFYIIVNAILFIKIIFESNRIFSRLHAPHSSLQEYSLPISSLERFVGNLVFYLTMVIAVGLVNLIGVATLYFSAEGTKAINYFNEHFASTRFFSYSQFALVYIFFFAGSIYFKESAVTKTLLVLVIFYLGYFIFFEAKFYSDVQGGYQNFQLGNDIGNSQVSPIETNIGTETVILKNLIHYGFYVLWLVLSYVKLSRAQYPG